MAKLIEIHYRTNEEYHPDSDVFYADYIIDLEKLKQFVISEDAYYAENEAKMILAEVALGKKWFGFELHDKYTFFDTEWELKQVEAISEEGDEIIAEVTTYLNM